MARPGRPGGGQEPEGDEVNESEVIELTEALPDHYADRVRPEDLDGMSYRRPGGEWQELVDLLIASLALTQAPVTAGERDELRSLAMHGRLDGVLHVAVAGLENIVPLLGIDQLIGQGIDRLTGGAGSPQQGLNALDRLMPGLSGVVRDTTNSSLIDNIKKMGEPTEIDKKPAIALPLRVTDGVISVGIIPVFVVPPLF